MKALTLRAARERKGWTQERLEAESGVDQAVISRIESARTTNPRSDTVARLERALGLRRGSLTFGVAA